MISLYHIFALAAAFVLIHLLWVSTSYSQLWTLAPDFDIDQVVYRASVSSLAEIPSAGFLAAYSRNLWTFPREFRGSITQDLPLLHEKLGII